MNAKIENVKMKLCAVADKLENSKAYRAVEKTAVTAGAGIMTAGVMAINSFADTSSLGSIALAEINSGDVVDVAMKFVNIGLPIFAVVGGLRLGMRFLRNCMS